MRRKKDSMDDPWFVWALIGVVCIGMEMLVPGFVIFFFGMGGLAVALCSLIPFVADLLWLQILLFIVFSTLSLVFLRKRFSVIFAGTVFNPKKSNVEDDGIGEIVELTDEAGETSPGRIRFRGTTWKAFSAGGAIPAGAKARIVRRDGMTYYVASVAASDIVNGGN